MPATAMYTVSMAESKAPAIFLRPEPQLRADLEAMAAEAYLPLNPFILSLLRRAAAEWKATRP